MYRAAVVVEQSRLDPRVFGICSLLEYSLQIVYFLELWWYRWRRDCEINGLRPKASDGCLVDDDVSVFCCGHGHGRMALSSITMLVIGLLLCCQLAYRYMFVKSLGERPSALKQYSAVSRVSTLAGCHSRWSSLCISRSASV